ncbi:MAG: hypothetical protein ACRCTE_04445 [Cellulosilyticaceae bacterium]
MTPIDEKLDELIKQSFETESVPDQLLNTRLRVALHEKCEKRQTLALYWLPVAASLTCTFWLWTLILTSQVVGLLELTLFGLSVVGNIGTLVLTLVGCYCFNLREEKL